MTRILLSIISILLTAAPAPVQARQCGALLKPECLGKLGAGAELAPSGNCGEQLKAYRQCLVATIPDRDSAKLSAAGMEDLQDLLKAALHHYDRHGGRFERRIMTRGVHAPDLLRVYVKNAVIYFYGKKELHQKASVDRLERSAVAEEYQKIMARISREHESWRERKAATARAIRELR